MSYEPDLTGLDNLSKRELCAFAVRCAKRVEPLYEKHITEYGPYSPKTFLAYGNALEFAVGVCHFDKKPDQDLAGTLLGDIDHVFRELQQHGPDERTNTETAFSKSKRSAILALSSAKSAIIAAILLAFSGKDRVVALTLEAANSAILAGGGDAGRMIESDLLKLENFIGSTRSWKRRHIPRDVFGEMWIGNRPSWSKPPSNMPQQIAPVPTKTTENAESESENHFTLLVDPQAATSTEVVQFLACLNEIYKSIGGEELVIRDSGTLTLSIRDEVPS